MQNLQQRILKCTNCPLHETRKNSIVGEGNLNAEILLVGEAPGADEDRVGRPFIGKSGQLLDKILEACGFTRETHIFISNIVRCRPPGNRVPTRTEVQTCLPYLLEQIELINPQIIITLGATSLKKLLGDESYKISRVRGNWIDWNGRSLMPVYHPAALLRNPNLKRETWADFQKVIFKYRQLVDPNHFSKHLQKDSI
ncbi:MAG: uracil-DNA glycosylase family 4 [Desulforhopalus sp.]|jgi:uracil-DNA glycosylase family 4